MRCTHCLSQLTVKNGHNERGVQRYKCNACKRRFCEKGIFARHRFPKEVIMNAIFLRSFPLSTRNVKRILKKFNFIIVSHKTIYNWLVKFVPHLIRIALSKPIAFTKIWHIDEKFIHVRGSKDPHAYLWIVSDSNSNIISTYVSLYRDEASARVALQRAKDRAGFNPELLISDGLQAYKKAVRKVFGRKTRHVTAHFEPVGIVHNERLMQITNNRAERINEFPALWLHICRGFKRLDRANLFCEFFAVNYNYFMEHPTKDEPKIAWEKIPMLVRL